MSNDADLLWPILGVMALVVFVAYSVAHCGDEQRECEARGGHLVSKYIYKGTLRLCVSADGRILE